MKTLFSVVLVATMSSPAAFAEQSGVESAVESVKTRIYDFTDKDVTAVSFEKSSSELSEAERTTLRSMVTAVRDDAKVDGIVVAAWSDKALPAENAEALTGGDKNLARDRGDKIETVLKELGVTDVEVYSMAEKPSWIGKVFNTSDAQIKESMGGKQVEGRSEAAIAKTIADKGGPSKAVVIIKREGNLSAE